MDGSHPLLLHQKWITFQFPITRLVTPEMPAERIELVEIQDDLALKIFHEAFTSLIKFLKLIPELKYPILKKMLAGFFKISIFCRYKN